MASVDWPGILIGGAITILVSWIFYMRAAEGLKRQTTLIMRGLEEAVQAGLIEYKRNEQGEIIGIKFKLNGVSTGRSGATGDLTVGDEDESDAPGDQE